MFLLALNTFLCAEILFIKVSFVPVFPKLVPIINNIVPKVQEHVSFLLKLVENILPEYMEYVPFSPTLFLCAGILFLIM